MNRPNQRIVYLNGDYVAESEARIPFRDRGVKFGDAVFDTTRTFGLEWEEVSRPRGQRYPWRPVLMLKECAKCS